MTPKPPIFTTTLRRYMMRNADALCPVDGNAYFSFFAEKEFHKKPNELYNDHNDKQGHNFVPSKNDDEINR